MRKRGLRFLAALLTAVLLICSDGVYALADTASGAEIVAVDQQTVDVTSNDVTANEEVVEPVELPEEELIVEEEIDMASFVDEFGNVIKYDAEATYAYTVTDGVLTDIKRVTAEGNVTPTGTVVIDAGQGITAIGATAFAGNEGVTYIVVPSGVSMICDGAFEGCSSLRGISLPKGVTALGDNSFKGCTSLTQISLPKTVETIGAGTFNGDSKLYIVYSDDADYSALTTIGAGAFEGCSSLTYFCSDTKVVFPSALTTIGDRAFKGCASLETLPLGRGITDIGEYAFADCKGITSVIIPENLTEIKAYTFANCERLSSVNIADSDCETIGAGAFKSCLSLGTVDCGYVSTIGRGAFEGCINIVSAYFYAKNIAIDGYIFTNDHVIYLYSAKNGSIAEYCNGKLFVFKEISSGNDTTLYKWEAHCIGGSDSWIKVTNADGTDPNATGGIEEGNLVYVSAKAPSSYGMVLKPGSLKMNGKSLVLNEENKYTFEMPKGGALVTAEFVRKEVGSEISGTDFSIQFTNGEVSALTSNQITLKLGEDSKIMLIDEGDGSVIPSSKITYEYASSTSMNYATVDKTGIIKTIKKGTSKVRATVTGHDGKNITKVIVIVVAEATINQLSIKADTYDSVFIIETLPSGVQQASINKIETDKGARKITLKATAYDTDDKNIATALTWATTDSKVAKLSNTTTEATNMLNTITVPKGASGEATITVTAKKPDGKTITQKFIISAQNYQPRIPTAEIVVNPQLETEATLKIIEAYGAVLENPEAVHFVYLEDKDGEKVPTSDDEDGFVLEYIGEHVDGYHEYKVITTRSLKEDSYKKNLALSVKKGTLDAYSYYPTVTFKVKNSLPTPKVSVASKYAIDTLYKNDGTVIKPSITGLSGNTIATYALEPLSDKKNDKLFTENFEIDADTGVITQKSETLKKTSGGKYAVTGYLVMTFDNYKDTAVVKKQITIPTKETAIDFALSATSGTFNDIAAETTVVLDVKNKATKKLVDLSDTSKGTYSVSVLAGSVLDQEQVDINGEGQIVLTIPSNPSAGSVKMQLTNDTWATKTVSFTYTIKTSSKNPTISLSPSKLTVNSLYPEEVKTFKLVSNQKDTNVLCDQTFKANSTKATKKYYDMLSVSYDAETGTGTVEILDETIKAGEYTFTCKTNRVNRSGSIIPTNTVTLKVTVVATKPVAKLGTTKASLNQKAVSVSGNEYADTATVTLKTTKLPETYTIDPVATAATLKCTSSGKAYFKDCVDMDVAAKSVNFKLNQEVNNGTYNLSFVPTYKNGDGVDANVVTANTVKIAVKVYTGTVSISLKASGTMNLLSRINPEKAKAAYYPTEAGVKSKLLFTSSNSIIYTPTITNISDKIVNVKIFAASGVQPNPETDEESAFFNATVLGNKIYVSPKEGVNISNNKSYKIMLFMQFENYDCNGKNGIMSKVLTVKTAQKLPATKKLSSVYNLYLSKKSNVVTFTVASSSSSAKLESIAFGDKDDAANSSFDISYVAQSDGTLKVTIALKDTVSYKCGSTNEITMYAKYVNQGTNSDGVATKVNLRINK